MCLPDEIKEEIRADLHKALLEIRETLTVLIAEATDPFTRHGLLMIDATLIKQIEENAERAQ